MNERWAQLLFAGAPLALGYLAGIAYLSEYLNAFGISINEIELSIPTVLSYSINVFSSSYLIYPLFLIFFVASLFYFFRLIDGVYPTILNISKSPWYFSIFLTFLLFVLFFYTKWAATSVAESKAKLVWNVPSQNVILRQISEKDFAFGRRQLEMLKDCLTSARTRQIFSTSKNTFSLCRFKNGEALVFSHGPDGQVISIRSISGEILAD
ncbi:hypothetical protein [Rhizobium sp. LjRoot254]|uniref:hypothetical protein n=1 Tax=Rhizobium sp. LjRoot254 TaxID=3342297 RepID=UPI003ECD7DE0